MLLLLPGVLLVTLKITVQLELAGIVMPVKLRAIGPPLSVPPQVPVTDPVALMFVRVSVNVALVSAIVLLLESVRVTTEVPPDGMEVGLKALLIVGGTAGGTSIPLRNMLVSGKPPIFVLIGPPV